MIKTVYNFNKMIIEVLSRMNNKLESKYSLIPLSYDAIIDHLNNRAK